MRDDGRRSSHSIAQSVAGHRLDRSYVPLLLTLGLGVFAGALDLGALSPALPAIARTFAVGPSDVAWLFTLYLFANVVSIPIATKLADTYGRRPVYIACVATFGAGSLLAIVAPSFWVLLLARAIQAAGAGGIFPVATAAVADRVPPESRGAALGLLGAVWGLAAIIGPTVGGLLTHVLSWHWIFIPNVPLALLVIARARTDVPETAAHARGPLDVAGIVTLAFGLLATMIALTRLDVRSATFGAAWLPAVAAATAVAAFVLLAAIERRAPEPVVSVALFGRRQLAVTYALEVLIGLLEGSLFFVPAALVAAQGMSYALAGIVAAIAAVVFVAVIPAAGRALDAFGSRIVLMTGALLAACGLGGFAFGLTSLPLSIVALSVAGVGYGALLGAPTRYIVTNETKPETRATAIGLLSIFLIVGQIAGGSLAGGITGSSIDDAGAFRHAYEAFAAIAVVTALLALALAPRNRERSQALS